MARTVRARTRTYTRQSGTFTPFYNHVQSGSPVTYSLSRTDTCSDSHGLPIVDTGFDSTAYSNGGISATGSAFKGAPASLFEYKFDKYPVGTVLPSIAIRDPIAAKSGWLLDLVAGTNPSRPVQTPLTLAQDLIQIPSQLREAGKLIRKPRSQMSPKEVANHYLCAQFGWAPLIEDVKQLLDLQLLILKRNETIARLYSAAGLRRHLKFEEDTKTFEGFTNLATFSGGGDVNAYYSGVVKRNNWGSIHWRPTSPPLYHPDDRKWNALSRRIVLGLTVEGMAKGVWDVIPWTWMIGWFSNVGKYLYAYSNTVPAEHGTGCLMRQSEITITGSHMTYGTGVTGNIALSGSVTWTHKTRTVSGVVTPGFNVPYLDTFRLSILAALFAQRLVK